MNQQQEFNHKTLQSFYDSAPMLMGIVEVLDDDIIHISDNKMAAQFFGHDQRFMQGKPASMLGMTKKVIKEWIEHYTKSFETKSPVNFEYWHETEEGKRHFSATVSFIEMNGSLPRFSYIVQDTTESREVRHVLKSQEDFLKTVLDNIPDMIFVKDARDLRFLTFNKAGEDLIGFSRADLIGKNDYDLFPEEQAEHFTTKDRMVLKEHKMVEITREPIETRFHGKRILHTKKIPLYDNEGNPKYLVGISEDVTEKIKAEENLQKMNHEKIARGEAEKSLQSRDEFISIASHELKSPLSALKLQAQMFRRRIHKGLSDAYSKEKVDQLIELTEKEVYRLDRLVNDMLDVSRIRTGNLSMILTPFYLEDLVAEVLERMKEHFISTHLPLPILVIKAHKLYGQWDHLRIEQVVVNLMTNAIRYGEKSQIEIELSQIDDHACLTVKDQGMGISEEKMDKIFGRFERAIERNEVSGLGLGLFISKKIVEAHHGKIWAENNKGRGTTFYVELPLSPNDKSALS